MTEDDRRVEVDERTGMEILGQIGLAPWSGEKWRTTWVRIVPIEITGRRTL
jgi:hypothetical protein